MTKTSLPVVVLIATGGTIAMQLDPVTKAPVPAITGDDLLRMVPGIADIASMEVLNHSNLPSAYLGPVQWMALTQQVQATLARPEVSGVIISHGTDSLEETAFWLDLTVASEKPIVVFGAQRNASEPDSDGPRNLLAAVRVAIDSQSRGCGALVVMNQQIGAAREATKTHTLNVESFQCGPAGFLGTVDPDRVVYTRKPLRRQHVAVVKQQMPSVEMVMMYGGCNGSLLTHAVALGAKGIVVQALGLGHVNLELFAAIQQAVSAGVAVVIASRVPNGRVLPIYGFEGGGQSLQRVGAVFADDLNPAKARILLMLLLQQGVTTQQDLQVAFSCKEQMQ